MLANTLTNDEEDAVQAELLALQAEAVCIVLMLVNKYLTDCSHRWPSRLPNGQNFLLPRHKSLFLLLSYQRKLVLRRNGLKLHWKHSCVVGVRKFMRCLRFYAFFLVSMSCRRNINITCNKQQMEAYKN